MLDYLSRFRALQFFPAHARKIAESPAFFCAIEQTLLEETVERRHYGCISNVQLSLVNQLADGDTVARPDFLQHAQFQRSQSRKRRLASTKKTIHGFPQ